jgi:hypothetical protein
MAAIADVLGRLRGALDDRGRVTDPALAAAIISRAIDGGADDEETTAAYVVVRPPASDAAIDELDALARRHLGGPLPADVVALYRETDGVWTTTEPPTYAGEYYEHGIRPIAEVIRELDTPRMTVTQHGHTDHIHLSVLPLFDIPDQGWHALDPWRGATWPVIAYWFDEVSIGVCDRAAVTAHCGVLANDLTTWLAQMIDHGMDPFWSSR